jgi:hypothetical protein
MMMEVLHSSETSVITGVTRHVKSRYLPQIYKTLSKKKVYVRKAEEEEEDYV